MLYVHVGSKYYIAFMDVILKLKKKKARKYGIYHLRKLIYNSIIINEKMKINIIPSH